MTWFHAFWILWVLGAVRSIQYERQLVLIRASVVTRGVWFMAIILAFVSWPIYAFVDALSQEKK